MDERNQGTSNPGEVTVDPENGEAQGKSGNGNGKGEERLWYDRTLGRWRRRVSHASGSSGSPSSPLPLDNPPRPEILSDFIG